MYIYQADVWCDECGESIKADIDSSGHAPPNPDDERTYDSGEYPKGPYSDYEESDTPEHCAGQSECLQAETLSDGSQVGYFFRNGLTTAGYQYLAEAAQGGGLVVSELWLPEYPEYTEQ